MDHVPTSGEAAESLRRQSHQLTPVLYTLSRVLRLRGVDEAGLPPLPPSELEVLRYVLDRPGTPVKVVARDLGLQPSNVSTTLRTLTGRGLVRREPDRLDRRSVRIYPTAAAEQGMAQIESAWVDMFADALAQLPETHRAALATAQPALVALGRALRDSGTSSSDC